MTQWDSTLLPIYQGRRIFYIEAYNSQYPSKTSTCYVSIIVTIECNESIVTSNLDTSTMQFRNQAGENLANTITSQVGDSDNYVFNIDSPLYDYEFSCPLTYSLAYSVNSGSSGTITESYMPAGIIIDTDGQRQITLTNDDNSYFNEYNSAGQFREYQILIACESFFENSDFIFYVIIEKNCTLVHLNLPE